METLVELHQKQDRSTLTEAAALADSIFFERKNPQVKKVLRKKLIAVKEEKQLLEDVIVTKNNEINFLKKSVESLNEVIKSIPIDDMKQSSNTANAKIEELKKSNRSLLAELELFKKKNLRLESKLHVLEVDLKKAAEEKKNDFLKKTMDGPLEELQSKLSQTRQKLFESLNHNIELKNQLRLAQKCIQQEIGENVNLNTLITAGTSWRGRAQQILSLQLKVTELKTQLENTRTEFGLSEDSLDDPPIRRDLIQHRAEVELYQKDIAALTSHVEEQNQKISALKVRNTNLVTDAARVKEKCSNLESVVQNNQSIIESLQEKLEIQKIHYENRFYEYQKHFADTQKSRENFEFQREELDVKLENLQTALKNKEEYIGQLTATVKQLEKDLKSVCGDYLFECRDFKKEEFVALLSALESEKNNLMSLNKTMNQRLESERSKIIGLIDQASKQKVKICRLEAKIRELEKEQNTQTDKKKRSQRISEFTNSINNSNSTVSSFIFENSSFNDIPSKSEEDQHSSKLELEDLKNRLEVSKEKITILKDKLNYLNEEKQNDTKAFENIITTSKTVLLDTIHRIKCQS